MFDPNLLIDCNYFGPKSTSCRVASHWKFTQTLRGEKRLITVQISRHQLEDTPILITGIMSGHRCIMETNSLLHQGRTSYREPTFENQLQSFINRSCWKKTHFAVVLVSKNRTLMGDRGWKKLDQYV